jgi:hypothetical protein
VNFECPERSEDVPTRIRATRAMRRVFLRCNNRASGSLPY